MTDIETGSESEYFIHNINTTEGFKGTIEKEDTEAQKSKYEWLTNDDLFDDFYASVFTKLTKNEKLIQAETAICLEEFTKNTPKDQLNIFDMVKLMDIIKPHHQLLHDYLFKKI